MQTEMEGTQLVSMEKSNDFQFKQKRLIGSNNKDSSFQRRFSQKMASDNETSYEKSDID